MKLIKVIFASLTFFMLLTACSKGISYGIVMEYTYVLNDQWEKSDTAGVDLIYAPDKSSNINIVTESLSSEPTAEEYMNSSLNLVKNAYGKINITKSKKYDGALYDTYFTAYSAEIQNMQVYFNQYAIVKDKAAYLITYTTANPGLYEEEAAGIVNSFTLTETPAKVITSMETDKFTMDISKGWRLNGSYLYAKDMQSNVGILYEGLTETMAVNEYADSILASVESSYENFELIENNTFKHSKYNAYVIKYAATVSEMDLFFTQYLFIENNTVYVITYTSPSVDDYDSDVEKMVKSFKIL